MDNDRMFKPLKIALASYDRKELRVQKHYLEEEGAPISCTCFLSGERLFRCLQQDHSFDVAILCNEMEDMTGLEFMEHIRALEQRPVLLLFNEARRNNESALCMETEEGIFCVEQADLKSLLRELYRMPGQQYNVSVSAVDSGIRRMIDQLEAAPNEAWNTFKQENGFADGKLTTGKLIYAVKNQLRRQKEP